MSNEFVEEYNVFLTGENSAVETYELALHTVTAGDLKEALVRCRNSHANRAHKLKTRVLDLCGTPADTSGMWGPFAAFCQQRANSELEAIARLEESEAERLVQYEAQQRIVPSPVLEFLTDHLLPAQHETHMTVSTMLKAISPTQ